MKHPFDRSVEAVDLSASSDGERMSVSQPEAPETARAARDAEQPSASDAGRAVASNVEPADEESHVAALARERDEYKDRLLRTTADFDNYRRRVTRERGELVDHVASDLLREILPIVDDLERALSAADDTENVGRYRQGVELIYRHLFDVLKKRGVTPIEALGADFDPHVHHAVAHEPSSTHRDGEVITELRKGYKIADRLLRASLVKVASRE
ncbi:MAG: nucleotide exchange factor GrpE [Luteitalea sp.]|nr:nucleotide exchange factor GrpE [Luteitalea sp.]